MVKEIDWNTQKEKIVVIDYKQREKAKNLLRELRIIDDFAVYHNNPKEYGIKYKLGEGMLFALVEQKLIEFPISNEIDKEILKQSGIYKHFKGQYDNRIKY